MIFWSSLTAILRSLSERELSWMTAVRVLTFETCSPMLLLALEVMSWRSCCACCCAVSARVLLSEEEVKSPMAATAVPMMVTRATKAEITAPIGLAAMAALRAVCAVVAMTMFPVMSP